MAADRGFVLSDHADWQGLISAIDATQCECVCLTHGYTASFARYLRERGYNAHEAHTYYGAEEEIAELADNGAPSGPQSLPGEEGGML